MANCTALHRVSWFCRAGWLFLAAAWVGAGVGAPSAQAQTLSFGAADDPREHLQTVWWRRENRVYPTAGFSLIGAQWRGAVGLSMDMVTRSFTGHLQGLLRAGILGEYAPDVDESYDLLRLVEFIRYEPPQQTSLHLRFGLLDRMRLGVGHVVNFFNTSVAWDERTVGAEAMYQMQAGEIAAFTDNLLLDGVTGGRLGLRPFFRTALSPLRSALIGFNVVADLAPRLPDTPRFKAYNVDVQFDLFQSGSIAFAPFASYAWYPSYGNGLALGTDLKSDNFIDLLSFRLRIAMFYNGARFRPGYVGTFYTIDNFRARILDAGANPDEGEVLASPTLNEVGASNDLLTELRVLVFQRFEFWYYFRRHFGGPHLSEMHLRLFMRFADRMRLEVGIDRGGLGSFFTLFGDLGSLNHLVFGLNYRVVGPLYLFLRTRYTYEQVSEAPDGSPRFLVQRRFEPLTGLRFSF